MQAHIGYCSFLFFYNGRVHRSVEEIPITNSHEWGIFILCSTLIRLYLLHGNMFSFKESYTHLSQVVKEKTYFFLQ